jgi:hypothetical protein
MGILTVIFCPYLKHFVYCSCMNASEPMQIGVAARYPRFGDYSELLVVFEDLRIDIAPFKRS